MEDRCISCGAIIPEGRQVCVDCGKFTDDEFIDDDFIKDLKWYVSRHGGDGSFESNLAEEALALINRQKAEIERLQKHNTEFAFRHYNDGIKEFAERLKATPVRFASITGFGNPPIMGKKVLYIDDNDIDNLVKEMTEGGGKE